MKQTLSVLCLAAFVAATLSARIKVQSDFDPNADFTTLKSWAWPPDGPGQMKMALTKDDDPEVPRKRFEPVIVAAVEEAMAKKGFAKAAAGGQFIPGTMEWGIPPFEGRTQSLKIYEQGTLVLDVMTPDGKKPIWRAIARAELNRERADAERDKNLRGAVFDLVKEFPPKKAKKK